MSETTLFTIRRFEDVPPAERVRAFGVEYVKWTDPDGGEMFITRHGWPYARWLKPEVWFTDGRYHKDGVHLTGGTGLVYRLRVTPPGEPRVELVVKISRFAEHVPLFMPTTMPGDLPGHLAESARFNSPFEEFGLVEDLRLGAFGPPELRILTKRPLAIYCTPGRFPLWQLGRTAGRFREYQQELNQDQATSHQDDPVHLDIDRRYIMLFGWVSGYCAEDAGALGEISDAEMAQLTERVNRELAAKGFRILDNKPKHFILRRNRKRQWICRHGELVYVQVDFELLQRTEEYLAHLQNKTRSV